MPRSLVRLALALSWAAATSAQNTPGGLIVDEPAPLIVDQNGNASTTIVLKNSGEHPVKLQLSLADFEHVRGARRYALGTTSTFAAVPEADNEYLLGAKPLDATKSVLTVKVSVGKVWEAGESSAALRNQGQAVPLADGKPAVLKAIRVQLPFNVTAVSPDSGTAEIHFASKRALLMLKNADACTYRFRWQLRWGDTLMPATPAEIELPPNSTVPLDVSAAAPPAGMLAAGTLKDEVSKGDLILEPIFEGVAASQPVPLKQLPLKVRVSYWSGGTQRAVNLIALIVVLLAGGTASIWVHCGLPNASKGLALRRRLDAMASRIEGLGDIDSRWRALLASRNDWIRAEMSSTWWIFPASGAMLDNATRVADSLEQWVAIAYDTNLVLGHLEELRRQDVPPTLVRWIEDKCRRALEPLEKGVTASEELEAMRAELKSARTLLAGATGPLQDLETEITNREAALSAALPGMKSMFGTAVPGLLAEFERAAGQPLAPPDYSDRDFVSLKIQLLAEYRELYDQTFVPAAQTAAAGAEGGASSSAGAPPPALLRLRQHIPRLLDYLRPQTYDSLRLAILFLDEMRQDIYDDALRAELPAGEPRLAIETEPRQVEPGKPVKLELRFLRRVLNDAAARSEWECRWEFSGGGKETGWEVFHAFRPGDEYKVTARLYDLDGKELAAVPGQLGAQSPSRGNSAVWMWKKVRPSAETLLEASRLALVLALAVFGLIATAEERAGELSFLQAVGVVFALGFGADTLKNIMTQRQA